jgi:hypothetical protein
LDENVAIKEYANECFRDIAKTYGSKALVIDHLLGDVKVLTPLRISGGLVFISVIE